MRRTCTPTPLRKRWRAPFAALLSCRPDVTSHRFFKLPPHSAPAPRARTPHPHSDGDEVEAVDIEDLQQVAQTLTMRVESAGDDLLRDGGGEDAFESRPVASAQSVWEPLEEEDFDDESI